MDYRREIDGLRAIAVLPVILFHAGFKTFSGGFVGVDVFFVISGYLITTIILNELDQGKFSIVNFYERRARRILPALFLVMLVCIPFAWFWFLPRDMKDFAQSLLAVPLFASNVLFWRESGYFDTAAELKPLLHTWSLAVEEQYYLLFPLFLMVFWKLGKAKVLSLLAVVFLVSLVVAQWGVHTKPDAAFYLLPTRGWELLMGSFAAFYLSRADRINMPLYANEIAAFLGISLILLAVFMFNKTTPFPGLYALVPTLGAVLIIVFATQRTLVGRFLGSRLFVGIGLISYSAYLWHQPIFVFARHTGLTEAGRTLFLALALTSLVLAYLSWRFVETPFRNKSMFQRKAIFLFAIVGSLFFVGLGFYGHRNNGDVGQISPEKKAFLDYFENDLPEWRYFTRMRIAEMYRDDCNFYDTSKYRHGQATKTPVDAISPSCYTKKSTESQVIFIWGDSHAQQLNHGIRESLPPGYELLQVASSGCSADASAEKDPLNYCAYSNWFAFDAIRKIQPEIVIVGQSTGHDFGRMERLADDLNRAGVKRVIFTGPSPHWSPSLPAVVLRAWPKIPQRTYSGVDRGVMELDKKLKSSFVNASHAEYISLIDHFCNLQGCLVHYDADVAATVTSWDYGHLTPLASSHLAKDHLLPLITKRQ